MIRSIQDPEHPLTLESLKVVSLEHCHVDEEKQQVTVFYNPTVPQCTLTTVIGLSIHTVLDRCLPTRFHVCRHHSQTNSDQGARATGVT